MAAATETIRLFPDVACLPLRPPAVLARSAASLDLLSDGRVELGLGAGYFLDPIAGMGGPRYTAGDSVDALEEAIGVIRAIWTARRADHPAGALPPAGQRIARTRARRMTSASGSALTNAECCR